MIHFTVFATGSAELANSEGHDILGWYYSPNFVDNGISWINNDFIESLSNSKYFNFSVDLILELLKMFKIFLLKKRLNPNAKIVKILQNLCTYGIKKFEYRK
jgi:hypothetical protein